MRKLPALVLATGVAAVGLVVIADPLPPDTTYRPLPTLPFSAVKQADEAAEARGDAAPDGPAQRAL